jgi:hypothetical protein
MGGDGGDNDGLVSRLLGTVATKFLVGPIGGSIRTGTVRVVGYESFSGSTLEDRELVGSCDSITVRNESLAGVASSHGLPDRAGIFRLNGFQNGSEGS